MFLLSCSGGSSDGVGKIDTTAVETCYDVQITKAGVNQTENICTTRENGRINGLGIARFIKFNVASSSVVSIRATRTSGLNPADPDIFIYKNGLEVANAESTRANSESLSVTLQPGNHVVEINEYLYSVVNAKIQQNIYQQKSTSNVQLQATATPVSDCTTGDDSTVSGNLTFDRVNHSGVSLDYSNISVLPIQQALVEVICNGGVYSSVSSDSAGDYALNFPNNQASFVRVKAQMLNGSVWDFSVVDNTVLDNTGQPLKPVYAMDGSVFTASTDLIRNLHAASGWGVSNYSGPRVAGPFAILDSVRKAKDKILSVANVSFPALTINWSVDNSTATIGGSFYDGEEIFILGKENNDTDEYDEHVIIHEWGHYFEAKLSRTDSIGGPHSDGDILDIRVAFGEGFGNAFSAMVTNDPSYIDTVGRQQENGFVINMEVNNCENAGWYSECSVQSILYDLYDSNSDNDNPDSLNFDFSRIYNVLVGAQKNTEAMTSIFSFIKHFKDQNASSSNAIDLLLNAQSIDSVGDVYGSTQMSLNPGATNQLPIYQNY